MEAMRVTTSELWAIISLDTNRIVILNDTIQVYKNLDDANKAFSELWKKDIQDCRVKRIYKAE